MSNELGDCIETDEIYDRHSTSSSGLPGRLLTTHLQVPVGLDGGLLGAPSSGSFLYYLFRKRKVGIDDFHVIRKWYCGLWLTGAIELTLEELDQVFSVPTWKHASYQVKNITWHFRRYVLFQKNLEPLPPFYQGAENMHARKGSVY